MPFIPNDKSAQDRINEAKQLEAELKEEGSCLACKLGKIEKIIYYEDGIHALAFVGRRKWKINIKSGHPINPKLDKDLLKIKITKDTFS